MAQNPGRLLRAARTLLAGLFGLALLIGVPLVLWRFIGNPIDLLPESWEEARRMVEQRNLTTDLLLAVLAVVMWILWFQFVWATVWELFVIGPRAGRGQVARDAPGVPRFIRSVVSAVSSGLLSASVVAGASSAGSLLPDLVASAPVLAGEMIHGELTSEDLPAASTANVRFYRITDHDRVWDLAGQNDAMLQRILEMNSDQVKSPIDFRPGMKIRVPTSLELADAVLHESELDADDPASEPDDESGHVVHEVVEGDNLWNISKIRLAEAAGGEVPSNQDIVEEVADVVERNPDVIEDPDLIYPGELLSLRPVDDGDGDQVSESDPGRPAPVPDPDPVSVSAPASTTIQSVPVDPVGATVGTTLADLDESTEGSAGEQDIGSPDTDPAEADSPPASAPTPWIIGGAALSSALLGLYLAGRRQTNGFAVGFSRKDPETPGEETPPLLRAIARSADPRFITWVARRLDDTLAGHGTTAAYPTAMLVTPGKRLELQWPSPVVLTAPKWGMVDADGRRWVCDYAPDQPESEIETLSTGGAMALPAMLSLGRVLSTEPEESAGETELLVNIEHFGSIAVCGSPAHVFPAVRAMIFELAAGGQICRTRVTTVDFEVEGADILPAIDSAVEDDALEAAARPVEAGSTLQVFVVQATDAKLDRWFELAKPGTDVALILIGDVRSSRLGSRFVLDQNGTGEFHGLDSRVRVFGLESSSAMALEDLFRSSAAESLQPSGG